MSDEEIDRMFELREKIEKEEDFKKRMELIKEVEEISTEVAHSKADELLVEIVREEGYEEIAKMFEELPKWYA